MKMDSEDIDFLISFGCLIVAACIGTAISGTIMYIIIQFVLLSIPITNAFILSIGIPITLMSYFLLGHGVLPLIVDRWYAFKRKRNKGEATQ